MKAYANSFFLEKFSKYLGGTEINPKIKLKQIYNLFFLLLIFCPLPPSDLKKN